MIDTPSTTSEMKLLAESVGLDMEVFINELETGKYIPVVQEAIRIAEENGVENSSLYINDNKFTDEPTFENLKKEIEKELERISSNDDN